MFKLIFFIYLISFANETYSQEQGEVASLEVGILRSSFEVNKFGAFLNYESKVINKISLGVFLRSRNGSNDKLALVSGLKLNVFLNDLLNKVSHFEDEKLDLYFGTSFGVAIINNKYLKRKCPLGFYTGMKYKIVNKTRLVFELGFLESKLGINFLTK